VYIQSAFLRLFGRTWPAVLVTAALFAGIHLGGGVKLENAHTLLALFTLGAGMGVAFERTRNIVVPIVMHMGFNAANVGLTMWGG
jgi:membrane protease YdiL (CAAX protease family)